uniref:Tigger transposable element-derived protein 4-like n=1 Tax=Crassostrea virginica TaxID=6565 RepID=A0A8B8BCW9_CRAVI|nr:tigger transposable element-derived protein 4-like [Crassostrea virginica]
MDGSDKLPFLVIGKASNPRCKSLPVQYYAHKKAWMTSEIFISWIPGLLFVVKLVFLPPNTTSQTQPMDQGIIQNLKVHYRKRVLLRYITDIDQSKAPHVSILDAIHMLSQAWNCVTPQTINNCYRHDGFSTDNAAATLNDDEDFDVEDDIPLSRLREHALTPEVLTEFTRLDDEIQTSAELTDDDILEEIKFNRDTPTPFNRPRKR